MATIFSKLRIITLSNFHQLLDDVIDMNSVAACKQAARDLEEAKRQIMREAATARGRVGQVESDIGVLELKINTDTEHAQLLLDDDDPTNDKDAERIMERVVERTEDLEARRNELVESRKTADALEEASHKIVRKHVEMVKNIRRLEDLERRTKAKEQATGALEMASEAGASAEGVSIDNVQQRLRDRSFAADAQFDQALEGVSSIEDSVTTSKAKQLIAKMRAKKGGQAAPEAATGT